MICDMRIGLVAQDRCFASATSAVMDILTTAEVVRPQIDASIAPLELFVAASTRRVALTGGMTLTTSLSLRDLGDLDVIVVPAVGTLTGTDTEAALGSSTGSAVVRALQELDPGRSRIAAACTGVFSLAEAGLVDGRCVTTTWFQAPTFRARYPAVSIDLASMVVADGPFLTAGAAFAHIDLALALVRSVSPGLARQVAHLLLIDERPSQSTFVIYDQLQHDDPIVLAFERRVREQLDRPLDVSSVAAAIGTNRRSLERRTRRTLDLSPLEIVQRLRLERAEHLRQTTNLTLDEIARRVGYAGSESLRALRRRQA